MNLPTYEIILKIAELKNLTRTAEYFSYTPSRISQILKAVEEDLGVALFHRRKAGLVPTMECEALLPTLQNLLNSEKCFQEQLSKLKKIGAGTIRIGSFSSLSCHWLPKRLKAFGEFYPQIQFEQEKFIFLEPEDNWTMEKQLRKDGFQPHVQYRVKDNYTIMSLVENGLGLSILFGFSSPEAIGVPITALGAAGAATSLAGQLVANA